MPKIIGKATRVVETDSFFIDELAGNASTNEDTLSIARVVVSKPTSEPWLTLHYDEWICVLKGKIEMHFGNGEIVEVNENQTCFVSKGERFRPVFPEGDTEYIPVCLPAFKPERCIREEEGVSDVTNRLKELHQNKEITKTKETTTSIDSPPNVNKLYHMCQKHLWEEALNAKTPYYPPTFKVDGYYTHATAVPSRLIETANHFYTSTQGDWICIELNYKALTNLGIIVKFEEAMSVGDTSVSSSWETWVCPHIYSGLPGHLSGIVSKVYEMKRDDDGNFLLIEGL